MMIFMSNNVLPSSTCPSFRVTTKPIPALHRRNLISTTVRAEAAPPDASRRNLLIGLGGLYGTAAGLAEDHGPGLPIQAPNLKDCGPADFPEGAIPVDCCPPQNYSITNFVPPPLSSPFRVRRPAHSLDKTYLDKYKLAVQRMKALHPKDPRNFMQQANIHCAYCDGAYDQVGFPGRELQIHESWLFFPWHRIYLYFHERMLGSLIGDPTFALPFWNWDSPDGMELPAIYQDVNSSLYDKNRNQKRPPTSIIDLDYATSLTIGDPSTFHSPPDILGGVGGTDGISSPAKIRLKHIYDNLIIMYRTMVNAKDPLLFLGEPLYAGGLNPGPGSMETVPHSAGHLWTGDPSQPNIEDMGNFYSAGRDPIFYAHHSNIDRLWNVWLTLDSERANFTSPQWRNASFLFYDENRKLVRVFVKDFLNTDRLRYGYEDVTNLWKNMSPKKAGTGLPVMPEKDLVFPLTLATENLRGAVKRPAREGRSGDEVEVIRVEGIELDKSKFTKFDVYVNVTLGMELSPAAAECAGSFVHVPHLHKENQDMKIKTNLMLGITELLDVIGAKDDDSVVVTLVPRGGTVNIDAISIQLLPPANNDQEDL